MVPTYLEHCILWTFENPPAYDDSLKEVKSGHQSVVLQFETPWNWRSMVGKLGKWIRRFWGDLQITAIQPDMQELVPKDFGVLIEVVPCEVGNVESERRVALGNGGCSVENPESLQSGDDTVVDVVILNAGLPVYVRFDTLLRSWLAVRSYTDTESRFSPQYVRSLASTAFAKCVFITRSQTP